MALGKFNSTAVAPPGKSGRKFLVASKRTGSRGTGGKGSRNHRYEAGAIVYSPRVARRNVKNDALETVGEDGPQEHIGKIEPSQLKTGVRFRG